MVGRRRLVGILALAALSACSRPPRYSRAETGFLRFTADDVIRVLQAEGLAVDGVTPRAIATATPDPTLPRIPRVREGGPPTEPMVEVEARTFIIPSLGSKGGRIFIFDSAERLRSKRIWFARFPDLYPYVYPYENVLLWLDRALPAAQAERYEAALTRLG